MGIRVLDITLHSIARCFVAATMLAILVFELPVTAQTDSVFFPVGLGFTDVIPHQIVRLADDRLIIFAAKAQSVAQLEVYWTTVAGLPNQTSDFGGRLEVNLPSAPISVDAVYDGSTTVHVLMNTLNGNIYDYPFDTATNQLHPIILVATGSATLSGDYIGTGGVSGAVDLSGTLHIAYWQNGNHIIHQPYTYNPATNILTPTAAAFTVDINGHANHPALAVSPFDNSLTLGWVSEVGTPTRILARVRASNGTWGNEEIVSNQPVWKSIFFGINIDQGPVIVIGTDGTKHLTYIKDFDAPNQYGRVHYAVRHVGDTGWTDNELNTYSHDPAPAIDSSGQLYIIGHGPSSTHQNDDMYYMKQNPDGSWGSIILFALHQGNNYLDSSPSVKWSAVGWNRPEAVEFLFFAANNGLYTSTTIYYGRLPINAPAATPTPSLTPTLTNTPTETPIPSETPTPSDTPIPSDTPTPSLTPSATLTPLHTPTNTATRTPTSTSTPTNTPSYTPSPPVTNTPVPTVGPQTITVQISAGADDVNEDVVSGTTTFTATGSTVWIGTGTSATLSYTGLRFNNVAIPRGSIINTARLEFNASSTQWQAVALQIAAELNGNSAVFSATSRPSQRPLTVARVNHSSNIQWTASTWYQFDPMIAVVQEVVNQSSWQSGNSMSLILHGTGSAFGRKTARSNEGGATTAARLVISFTPLTTPSPTPSPTWTSSPTTTPTATSTPTSTFTATNTPTNTATFTPTNTATFTPTPTSTYTPTNTDTPTNTATPTDTPTNTPTSTYTATLTPSLTPTATDTPTDTPTFTPTFTPTHTLTPSDTPTNTPTSTYTATLTPSLTPTATDTPTDTPTLTPTDTPTNTATPTDTPTDTPTSTYTATLTPSLTPTLTDTPTDTPTFTPTFTPTNTATPTDTPTFTPTFTPSLTPTATDTPTNTPTFTPTNTATFTPSFTPTLTPSNTATFTPTFTLTPSRTPTLTPSFTPTRTPTSTPTPTNTPTFTPTATPVPSGGTITVQITSGADDINDVNGTLETSGATLWAGNGGTATTSFTGLRFNNVALPLRATITAARLELYSTQGQWISISFQMAADAADSSVPFTAANRPGLRTLTVARVSHASNVNWATNTWYPLEDIRTLVQEVVNRPNWRSGNSLSIILNGTGTNWGRKFFRSFEGGATFAARLVITYTS